MRTNFVNGEAWDGSEVNALAAELNSVADTANDAATAVAGKATIITPEQFGAAGNGSTNDAVALQAALDALDETKTLIIESGKAYAHHATLFVTTNGGTIKGGGEIRATNHALGQSSFSIQGNYVTVEDVFFTCPNITTRGGNIYDNKVVLDEGSTGCVLRRVTVDGARGCGIFCYGTIDYLLDTCMVKNSWADGIHNVNGSRHGVLANCSTENTGDDGISVLGYDGGWPWDGAATDILVHGFSVKGSLARGITAAGCINARFYDGIIESTTHSAIIVACESEWKTSDTSDVVMSNIRIRNANTLAPTQDRGAVFVANGFEGHDIDRIYIGDLHIQDTNPAASFDFYINKYTPGGDINGLVLGPVTFSGTDAGARFYATPGVGVQVDPSITNKPIAVEIRDTNGATALGVTAVTSAVNFVGVQNGVAGGSPVLYSSGSDPNVGFVIQPKGVGNIAVWAGSRAEMGLLADGAAADVGWYLGTRGAGRVTENGNIVGSWVAVPSTATSTGKVGQIAADASFLYICTATNTWRRVGIATW